MPFKALFVLVLLCCVGIDVGLYLAHVTNRSEPNPFMIGMGLILQLGGIIVIAMGTESTAVLQRHGLVRSKLIAYGFFALGGGLLSYWHGMLHGGELYVPLLR